MRLKASPALKGLNIFIRVTCSVVCIGEHLFKLLVHCGGKANKRNHLLEKSVCLPLQGSIHICRDLTALYGTSR